MSSPYKSAVDSPSRQLLWELSRFGISDQEEFNARLDRECHEREVIHRNALAAAVAHHTRVREGAENARRELELRIETERQRREDEERRELRKRELEAEKQLAERRAETERLRVAQLERQKQEQARKDAETARLQKEKKDREDASAKKDLERKDAIARQQAQEAREVERKANEAKIIEEKRRAASAQASTLINTKAPSPPSSSVRIHPAREVEHQRYRTIHKYLKDLRQFVVAESKKTGEVKQSLGDIRRQIKKSVGQLTIGQNANRQPVGHPNSCEFKTNSLHLFAASKHYRCLEDWCKIAGSPDRHLTCRCRNSDCFFNRKSVSRSIGISPECVLQVHHRAICR